MDFVKNLPSYHQLTFGLIASLPKTWIQWHSFIKKGGTIDRSALGPFESMADKLRLQWKSG